MEKMLSSKRNKKTVKREKINEEISERKKPKIGEDRRIIGKEDYP